MASRQLANQVLRGLIGDKLAYTSKPYYQNEELDDILRLAVFRHDPKFTIDSLPDTDLSMVCYRAAIDICYEMAAKNAPFNILNMEGAQFDKSGVMTNWLTLADKYKEMYQIEMQGGLGAEGKLLYGEWTKQSYTTGREVPYRQAQQLTPPILYLVSVVGLAVTMRWEPIRHIDFYAYKVMRATDGLDFEEIDVSYDPLRTEITDTLEAAGTYDYRVDVMRGVALSPATNYPFQVGVGNYLTTQGNVVTVEVN